MKQAKTKLFIILQFFTLLSCNNNPIGTEDIKPGRRDYVWTVDTLEAPYYRRMWASSATDIWAVSSGDWDNSIAHFDGEKWSFYGIQGLFNITTIYGFSSNNIFIGADNGSIWRYDGNSWKLFFELKKEGVDYFLFENIWGEFPNDFYAVGSGPDDYGYFNRSIIAHYANNNWTMLNTNVLKGDVVHLYKNRLDNKTYLRLTKIGGDEHIDSTVIYEYVRGKYSRIYGSLEVINLQSDISLINGEVYFILGNKIAIRRNNKFENALNVNNTNFYQRIWGRNSNDIFLMIINGLAHYNGNNIEYLLSFKDQTQIAGAAIFSNDVFFLVFESQTNLSLIYHGKLKE